MIRQLKHVVSRQRLAPGWILGCLCSLVFLGCSSSQNGSEKASSSVQGKSKTPVVATNAAPALAQVPLSAFSTNVTDGLDPFFPDSTRRAPRPAGVVQAVKPAQKFSTFLKLTGLWPSKTRPLALINKTPIAPGEEASIGLLVPNSQGQPQSHKLLVRCLEIRASSVLISVEGESGNQELMLQSKL
jgi:hypothetical protein